MGILGGGKPDTSAQEAELARQQREAQDRADKLARDQQEEQAAFRRRRRGRRSLIATSESGTSRQATLG